MGGCQRPTRAPEPPRIGEPLPAAADAHIDPKKLIGYALDPDHPVGQHKAAVFRNALAIGLEDWEYLRDALLMELPKHAVSGVRAPTRSREAFTWEVRMPIRGLRSRAARRLVVITAWQMIAGRPELVTIRVAPRAEQEGGAG